MHSLPIRRCSVARIALLAGLGCALAAAAVVPTPAAAPHEQLVIRLRALGTVASSFGPAYQPLYAAGLPWYEQWGGNPAHAVDDWMVPPEGYAVELADALEHGRNFFADNPGALLPMCFETKTAGGEILRANYWIILPAGFAKTGRRFPLIISLHGSGWLGHKISFVRQARKAASAGRAIEVTPIDEGGPWRIDFLNAYLDRLLSTLPVDPDHVYVEGHSLGAMATWEWAVANPERFAAISPRAGAGEPFRAVRLKHVPVWVIHGADDTIVPRGCSDQMVAALLDCGASVRYTVLAEGQHNMPDDLDEGRIVDWYLQQTRSHEAVPADPLDGLGLADTGYSPGQAITLPEQRCWKSEPVVLSDLEAVRQAMLSLFKRAHELGLPADAPIMQRHDAAARTVSLWLAVPRTLRRNQGPDPASVVLPAARYIRFFFRGPAAKALAHVASLAPAVEASGQHLTDTVWVTPLTLRPDTPTSVAEYRVQVN